MTTHQYLDTQVVSYAMKGKWDYSLDGCVISSIVANELFLVHGNDPANANLYIPLISNHHTIGLMTSDLRRRDHPFNRHHTDSIVMDFANVYPTIVEYNNLSISVAINNGFTDLMSGAFNHLDKETRKTLKRRFKFLVENKIRCVPLRRSDIESAFELLARFCKKYNFKGNFRNTWNDLLILSSAMGAGEPLVTEDNLLSRFASEDLKITPKKKQDFVELSFSVSGKKDRTIYNESKRYINTGWRVKFSRPPIPFQ